VSYRDAATLSGWPIVAIRRGAQARTGLRRSVNEITANCGSGATLRRVRTLPDRDWFGDAIETA